MQKSLCEQSSTERRQRFKIDKKKSEENFVKNRAKNISRQEAAVGYAFDFGEIFFEPADYDYYHHGEPENEKLDKELSEPNYETVQG